jgi:predicted metal-dependent TIM-barrel fold hydrolase
LEFLTLEGNPLTTLPQSITDINCLQIQWNHDMVFSPSELIDHLNTSHLKQLIAKGKIYGYLKYDEVINHLPKDADKEQIQEIFNLIKDMKIKIQEI